MHLNKLLHKTFSNTVGVIDKRNHCTLMKAVETLCQHKFLSIAALGRKLKSNAKVKHNIKRIDRLFGNPRVQHFRYHDYQEITRRVIGQIRRPCVTIDWSGLTPCGEFHLLRAAVPVKGRAMTIYEQSFHECEYMKQSVHKDFLKTLKSILPSDCKPIIVTDAGFRNPWFKLVLKFGWDFVGRVRHQTQYQKPEDDTCWLPVKTLYSKATAKPVYLFETQLAKANSLSGHFYLFKSKPKQRKKKNLRGKTIRCSVSLKHAKGATEPWLLFTSLCNINYSAQDMVKIYSQRMQIEESFRDLKNTSNGLNLRHCRSYEKGRLNVALLIALIANFILWLAGLTAKILNVHRSFQANTIKNRNVLSSFSLGTQYFEKFGYKIKLKTFLEALKQLNKDCRECL